jgi:signal transduction histidine kinase/CheY-like chemotaxis protein
MSTFRPSSFRAKVLIPVITVMVLLLAVTVLVVNLRFRQQMEDNAGNELDAASLRFRHSQVVHRDKLYLWFRNLANEPKYRAALMNEPFDPATVRDSLARLSEDEKLSEQGVDFVFYTPNGDRPAGKLDPMMRQRDLAISPEVIIGACDLSVRRTLQGKPAPDTIHVGDKLYNVISLPVYYPQDTNQIIGALTFGEELGWRAAQEFSVGASCRTVFFAGNHIVASTLAGNEPADPLTGPYWELAVQAGATNATTAVRRLIISNKHFFCSSGVFPSLKGDNTLGYLLFSSYESQLLTLYTTRFLLLTLSLIAILASSAVVWFFVRKVTEPLRELRDSAEAVGRGDFTRRVEVRSRDECGELATVFNQMTGNLQQSRAQLEKTVETLKSTQAQLIQSEKLSAVGEFVAGVAHELNNPLTAVMGFSEILKDADVGEKTQRHLDMIFKSAQRCQKIVQSLLSFARRQPSERQPMSVNKLIEAVLEIVSYPLRTSNIEVVLRLDPALPVVLVDGHQIQQVLLNVINNARQAMESHHAAGKITITTEVREPNVCITIQDNGPGISESNLHRIFDPFFTTKEVGKGTGLGLSLCYGIIKEHGGNITPSSRPGEGAKFVIELPIADDVENSTGAASLPASGKPDPHEGAGKKILVIDDEETILQMISEVLKQHGYAVDVVTDGETGLRLLDRNHYDATLCDWKMPGLNGWQVYERLRAASPGQCRRIIFITGDVVNEEMRALLEQEKCPCLAKPFALNDVLAAIKAVTASP